MQLSTNANPRQRTTAGAGFVAKWHRFKRHLFRHWWILIVTILLALGIQWLWLKHRPPSFVSYGKMIVNVKLDIPSENTYSEELDNFYGTQVALMEGDSVVDRVIQSLSAENPGAHPVPVEIQVTVAPKTSIFNLKAVGGDPRYTQDYLEATMEQYIDLKKELLANASSTARSDIQKALEKLALKVQQSKQDYLDFQSSNSIVLLQADGGNSAAAYLSSLSSQLAEHQSELQLLKTLTLDENLERERDASLQAGSRMHDSPADASSAAADNAAPGAPGAGSSALPNDVRTSLGDFEEGYYQAKAQLILLKANRDELSKLAPLSPQLVKADADIANQEKLLQMYKEDSEEQLRNQQHTLEVEITNLQNQIAVWQPRALEASKKLADFEVLKENSSRLQAMYDQLQGALQTLEVDKETDQESVSILEHATPPRNIPLETLKRMSMAGLIGLVAGLCILMLLDKLDDSPVSVFELEAQFDHPVLAQFPLVKPIDKKAGVPILQMEDDRWMLVEAYQNLRSAVMYKDSVANHPRRIVITSARAGAGKSNVAANFAVTLAQSGARVLLVDADLRRGILHKHFGVAAEPGLAEVLNQQCQWSKAVVPTSIPNLFLLPAGACPRHPGSLFARRTGKFLADIAGHYDYYLFDTSPIMAADDVSNLAPLVDGVILVIRAGVTSSRIAEAALELLRLRQVNVIGLAFNAVEVGPADYYYYGDKSYYPTQSGT